MSLLEDDAFRIVSQLFFFGSDGVEYDAVKTCLKEQFAPRGVELEWQRKLHSAYQERQETLLEFSGRLRADASGQGLPVVVCRHADDWKWRVSNLFMVFPLPLYR